MKKFNRGTLARGTNIIVKCGCCGRRYQSHLSDSNVQVCPVCYDSAGQENEHFDGHHEIAKKSNCPFCLGIQCMHEQQPIAAQPH